jgi:5-methylcytosine-specific restriction endonuclease McrA
MAKHHSNASEWAQAFAEAFTDLTQNGNLQGALTDGRRAYLSMNRMYPREAAVKLLADRKVWNDRPALVPFGERLAF